LTKLAKHGFLLQYFIFDPDQLPGPYNDRLICMISSQLHQAIPDFDEVLTSRDSDFNFDE